MTWLAEVSGKDTGAPPSGHFTGPMRFVSIAMSS